MLRGFGSTSRLGIIALIRYTIEFPDPDQVFAMTQDELKALVVQAAADYVLANMPEDAVLDVDTDSTADLFIDAMTPHKTRFAGAVSNSEASICRLQGHGFTVFDLDEVNAIPAYVDGTDEVDASGAMIKGGGDALTREKTVASVAKVFICVADGSKLVEIMGAFPLPVGAMPMVRATVTRQLTTLGGQPRLRMTEEGQIYRADNGNVIVDVVGLRITDPKGLESVVNKIPGVVTVGLFAERGANVLLPGTEAGVQRRDF